MIVVKDDGKSFQLIPAGSVAAVCNAVWDIGFQKTSFNGEEKIQHKIIINWETTHLINDEKSEYNGKRMVISKRYTASLNEKATLSKDLESWRGKSFTREERDGFDVEKLIGANCILSIVHQERNGKTYANISTVSKAMPNQEKLIPETTYPEPPEWVKKLQAESNGSYVAAHKEKQEERKPHNPGDLQFADEESFTAPAEGEDIPF